MFMIAFDLFILLLSYPYQALFMKVFIIFALILPLYFSYTSYNVKYKLLNEMIEEIEILM